MGNKTRSRPKCGDLVRVLPSLKKSHGVQIYLSEDFAFTGIYVKGESIFKKDIGRCRRDTMISEDGVKLLYNSKIEVLARYEDAED